MRGPAGGSALLLLLLPRRLQGRQPRMRPPTSCRAHDWKDGVGVGIAAGQLLLLLLLWCEARVGSRGGRRGAGWALQAGNARALLLPLPPLLLPLLLALLRLLQPRSSTRLACTCQGWGKGLDSSGHVRRGQEAARG